MRGTGGLIEALVVEVWRYKRLAWGRWDKSANRCFVQVKLIDVCISLSTGEIDAFVYILSFPANSFLQSV